MSLCPYVDCKKLVLSFVIISSVDVDIGSVRYIVFY